MNHNSCWAKKIAVTKDGKIRPCIYSNIVIGNMYDDEDIQSVVKKALKYWDINKDKVEKCKNCELRYACFDCREIAQRKSNGNLYAKNPYCNYDPFKGKWIKE
jgi:radical SAM protein with 4Fe4S-binding SPASM domain